MFAIAIHGGAGSLPRAEMTPDREAAYRAGLVHALDAGRILLASGGSAVDAVTVAAAALEDDPLFNAGRGAVFNADGRHELDAAIMDGRTRRAGAVCGLMHVANPVRLARAVMDRCEHVMLSGAGAEEFALGAGFALVPQAYFHTAERHGQLERLRATSSPLGTVGAVALDLAGALAAATSTGGMTGKRWGRIGDSPVIGAGTYADGGCAVSATGHGEMFIRAAVAHDICARIRYGGRTLDQAVREVVFGELADLGGEGGVIAIDALGNVSAEFNSEGMFRASVRKGEPAQVAIYPVPD